MNPNIIIMVAAGFAVPPSGEPMRFSISMIRPHLPVGSRGAGSRAGRWRASRRPSGRSRPGGSRRAPVKSIESGSARCAAKAAAGRAVRCSRRGAAGRRGCSRRSRGQSHVSSSGAGSDAKRAPLMLSRPSAVKAVPLRPFRVGRHAVEHVHAAPHRLDDVVRIADPHEVARAAGGESGFEGVEHAVRHLLLLAHGESADRDSRPLSQASVPSRDSMRRSSQAAP